MACMIAFQFHIKNSKIINVYTTHEYVNWVGIVCDAEIAA